MKKTKNMPGVIRKNGEKRTERAKIKKKAKKTSKKAKKEKKTDKKLFDIVKSVSQIEAAEFFGVSRESIRKWALNGCPREASNKFNLPALHIWLMDREREKSKRVLAGNETQRKLEEADLRIKNARIKKMEDSVIDIDKHAMIMQARASGLQKFLTDSLQMNRHRFVNKTADQLKDLFFQLAKQMMQSYVNASKAIE